MLGKFVIVAYTLAQGRQKTDAEYADDLVEFIGPSRDAMVITDQGRII